MLIYKHNMKKIIIMVTIFLFASGFLSIRVMSEEPAERSPKEVLQDIYGKRCEAFITGETLPLKELFDTSQKYGVWALEHEVKRVQYLNKWADERNIEFVDVKSSVRFKKVNEKGNKTYMALEESYKFDYIYPDDSPTVINSFGVGLRHWVSMIKKDGKWLIYNDWYTDCFEDALRGFTGYAGDGIIRKPRTNAVDSISMSYGGKYNREKAVAYADKYCGAAWGSGNNFKYNHKYTDFNGIGGDCTNFASQVLGDKEEGGGIPFDGSWFCVYHKYGNAQGSTAWCNADGLKNYLLYSGRGRLIRRGTYKELVPEGKDFREGYLGELQLGDFVSYEKKGNIDHFAVVTSRDSRGYPLVNSHTTDRYHVPWDLGWGDSGIRFYLIHITY